MKTWFGLIAGCLLAVHGSEAHAQSGSLQDLAGQLASPSAVTTIYLAKEFITIDPKKPRAEAIAVRDGRFLAIGTLDDVRAAAGEEAKVDKTFEGKVVVAGFVEQHVHPVLAP